MMRKDIVSVLILFKALKRCKVVKIRAFNKDFVFLLQMLLNICIWLL